MHRRTVVAALGALLVVVLVAVVAISLSGDDNDEARVGSEATTSTTTTAPPGPPTLAWTVTGVEPNGTEPPGGDVVAAVQATLDAYLAQAVVSPLFSGTPAGDLSGVLSPAALERLAADPAVRATLVDEGMPPATTSIAAEIANVALSTVSPGPGAAPALIAATLDLKIHAVGPTMDVDIVRQGDVVLAPEPAGWRIDSFQLRAQRDSRV